MRKLNVVIMVVIFVAFAVSVFSSQFSAKQFGGVYTVNLAPNYKLINATWKANDLWILTQPMTQHDLPITTTFQEYSNLGILQGKVIIIESK